MEHIKYKRGHSSDIQRGTSCKGVSNNIIKKFSITGKIGITIVFLFLLIGIFSNCISLHPYNAPSGSSLESPSLVHWLGTDDLGIDLWAQICFGARVSIMVGFGTALLAGLGGSLIGIFSGYFGGLTDKVIMRLTDMMIVLPDLPVLIVLGAFFGPSVRNIIIVLALFSWTIPARIVRSKVISVKEEKYVTAAKSYGANFWHLTIRHFLPNILPIVMVNVIRLVSRAIVAEAGLAFLGLGDPTSKSWGLVLNHAINFRGIYFTDYWKWWVVSPIAAITFLVTATAFIGRDVEKIVNSKI
ncbi:MAG: peptide/nickel transport system permease protein [Petroclostridium sp.]|jgi:peptide/nickel transport system permease protein|uniref:ABC transporter permease n=1 Tax=Petroclostridium xylanilyticum TaxID=1792311 RepID=UPI000B98AD64|nr:ABC transporter permease [Petroclostridium xylanilyticum]MBZ4645815.1 dppC [Clostridia bacterium]MDK2811515.1 peptide/nickel transport system permease protein [Petroclostridium sp.]